MCRCGRSTQVRPDGSYCRSLMDISGEVISGASGGPASATGAAGVAQDPYHHAFLVPDRRQVLEASPPMPVSVGYLVGFRHNEHLQVGDLLFPSCVSL